MSGPRMQDGSCLSRREFLLVSGTGAASVLLCDLFGERLHADDRTRRARFAPYPRKQIGRLSKLEPGKPQEFLYPDDGPHSISMLIKLGERAGGGIGPGQDVVAFNALCPHQGGLLRGAYNGTHRLAGPCPLHLTTFDLTRHGMVVAGHATQGLPQVVLELEEDAIHAVGVLGLIYGYPHNTAFIRKEGRR